MYFYWFKALQLSPWYANMELGMPALSNEANATFKLFGEVSKTSFDKWWMKTGVEIFAEKIPYNPVSKIDAEYLVKKSKSGDAPDILRVAFPMNLDNTALIAAFKDLLEKYRGSPLRDFDRFAHSTATVHEYRESRVVLASLKNSLEWFERWTVAKANDPDLTMADFSFANKVNPVLSRKFNTKRVLPADREQFANALSTHIKFSKNLIAHATEGIFPCATDHHWAQGIARNRQRDVD